MKEHQGNNSDPSMNQFMDMLSEEEKTWSADAMKHLSEVDEQAQFIIAEANSSDSKPQLPELEAGGQHELAETSGYSTADTEVEKQDYPYVTTETEVYDGEQK